jgi:hypothetical protein
MGIIIGAAAGGGVALIAILLICLCFIRRRRLPTHNDDPVDLLRGYGDEFRGGQEQFTPFYQPVSFQVPDVTVPYGRQSYDRHQSMQASNTTPLLLPDPDESVMSASYGRQSSDPRQSIQTNTTTSLLRSSIPDPHSLDVGSSRASSHTQTNSLKFVTEPLRPVNIILHNDAGSAGEQIPETIELPPAYSNIQNDIA